MMHMDNIDTTSMMHEMFNPVMCSAILRTSLFAIARVMHRAEGRTQRIGYRQKSERSRSPLQGSGLHITGNDKWLKAACNG